MKLFPHQIEALQRTEGKNRVAFYHDPGMGKTFTGSRKLMQLDAHVNLVVCQKSKVQDWVEHFRTNYSYPGNLENGCAPYQVVDLTTWEKDDFKKDTFITDGAVIGHIVYIINYELAFRRPDLLQLERFTLMLDESSMIQNEQAKRTKFILKMNPLNVILLSGTPTAGKYERLWSQCHLLGWPISKQLYFAQYIVQEYIDVDGSGFKIPVVKGYKNVDRLKEKLNQYGADFLKADEVLDLPQMNDVRINVPVIPAYTKFRKKRAVTIGGVELIGDTTLTMRLYMRMLCGHFNRRKLEAFEDLLESTDDRLIVFYNFNAELEALRGICKIKNRPVSVINGSEKDLTAYQQEGDSVTLIQYQAGAMGLNLQQANKVVYFTLPERSELFEQSKKRIHRIGQERPCFYFYLMCKGSVEDRILTTLKMRKDYTDELFRKDEKLDS